MRLATIAWRGLLARPLRTALAVIGVALGVAVVAATVITTASSDAALRSATADLLGAADVRLRAFAETGFTPRAVQALRAMPEIAVAAPVSERRLIVHTDPGEDEKVFSLLAIGIDPVVDVSLREPRLTAGVPLSTDSPTDALVAASWAARNGLELGDQLPPRRTARGDAAAAHHRPHGGHRIRRARAWGGARRVARRRSTSRSWSRRRSDTWISTSVRPVSRKPSRP